MSKHDWEDFESFKRRCRRCGKEQWLVENKFPEIGEPKFEWLTMHRDRTGDCEESFWRILWRLLRG